VTPARKPCLPGGDPFGKDPRRGGAAAATLSGPEGHRGSPWRPVVRPARARLHLVHDDTSQRGAWSGGAAAALRAVRAGGRVAH